jgi:hypothetical protein
VAAAVEALCEEELAVELPDEPHAARAANEVTTAADDSHRIPASVIVHASKCLRSTTVA